MGFKSFLKQKASVDVATWLLTRIVDRMAQRDYEEVMRLFGAKLGPYPEDDEPVSVNDLGKFGGGKKPP